MKIERSNILELIGTGKNKYHSCVITSYSIDLAFFEQLILPRLRGAGITNINLFVDAGMLEKYLASHLGNSPQKIKANYSITPVHLSGAFHPKMIFLAGKSKGYLSVGSGNITSSGLLYNDEIWSSFYTSKERVDAHPIFKSAWQYILSLSSSHCLGINLTKIDWIQQHSQWVQSLKNIKEVTSTKKEVTYNLSYTQKDYSLFMDVISKLAKKPNSIKIIAPYYNKSGAFLQKLIDDLDPFEMHCVVDTTNGILPVDFNSNRCQFSDWSDVIKSNTTKSIQRLHAKIIQLEYDAETIFILGSANATLEAYGISNRDFKNEEAVVTIKSIKPRDFIKELGVRIPKIGTLNIKKTKSIEIPEVEIKKGLFKLKYIELIDQSLKITLNNVLDKPVILKTFDSTNELLEEIEVVSTSKRIEASLTKTLGAFKVALFDIKKIERISTFGLVQNINSLKKSNPDERLARLQSFEHLDIFNSLNYELVLDFLDQEQVFKDSTASQALTLVNTNIDEDEGQVIPENEYNKNASITLEEQVTSENITSMVEEFLDVLKIRDNQEELSSNSEELALEAGDDGMDNSTTLQHSQKFITSKEGQRIARKIKKTINTVSNLIHSRSINEIPQDSRTLNALFVGFHILLHFWDEVYIEELSIVKVYYKKINELSKLEKQFGLKRLESQINSSNNEVSYYIDYSLLNTFQNFIESNKAFRIIESPSVPMTIEHSIIRDKYIQDYTSKNWLFDFMDLGVSQVIMAIKSSEFKIDSTQKLKLLVLSNQLINKIKWNMKFDHWKKLLLLNIYDITNLKELLSHKKDLSSTILDWNFCNRYLNFKQGLAKNTIKSTPVNSQLIGNIVFSKVMGFGYVRKTLKDSKIEFYSPLNTENTKVDESGIYKTVYISKQVKVFGSS
tara:strand:- start:11343 stop:14045 length:2703 start_codon:yes stop_codon:yes gene_type:complete